MAQGAVDNIVPGPVRVGDGSSASACPLGYQELDPFIRHVTKCDVPIWLVKTLAWACIIEGAVLISLYTYFTVLARKHLHQKDFVVLIGFIVLGLTVYLPFGFPAHVMKETWLLVIVAVGMGLQFLYMPIIFDTSFVRGRIKAVCALDAKAESEIIAYFGQVKPFTHVCAIGVTASFLGMGLSTGSQVYMYQALFCASYGVGSVVGLGSNTYRIYRRLNQLPSSAQAYMQEYPYEQKVLRNLRDVCGLELIVHTVISLVFIVIAFIPQTRRFGGLIVMAIMAISGLQHAIVVPLVYGHIIRLTRSLHRKTTALMDIEVPSELLLLKKHVPHKMTISNVVEQCTTPDETEMYLRGVSLAFLKQFLHEMGVQQGETTEKVCNRLIKPHTKDKKVSYWSMVKTGMDQSGNSWTGAQSIFVSHSWSESFRSLIDTIDHFEQAQDRFDKCVNYYHIDCFCLNQHMKGSITEIREYLGSQANSERYDVLTWEQKAGNRKQSFLERKMSRRGSSFFGRKMSGMYGSPVFRLNLQPDEKRLDENSKVASSIPAPASARAPDTGSSLRELSRRASASLFGSRRFSFMRVSDSPRSPRLPSLNETNPDNFNRSTDSIPSAKSSSCARVAEPSPPPSPNNSSRSVDWQDATRRSPTRSPTSSISSLTSPSNRRKASDLGASTSEISALGAFPLHSPMSVSAPQRPERRTSTRSRASSTCSQSSVVSSMSLQVIPTVFENETHDDQATINAFLLQTLDRTIDNADTILVAISKWDEPSACSRIWCLFEIWLGIMLEKKIRMGFPQSEAIRFTREVLAAQDVDIIEQIVHRTVDVRKAAATVESDLAMIRGKIRESVGEDRFNDIIRTKLMAHLVHCRIHTCIPENMTLDRTLQGAMSKAKVSPEISALE